MPDGSWCILLCLVVLVQTHSKSWEVIPSLGCFLEPTYEHNKG
jgi:hypothetical protein